MDVPDTILNLSIAVSERRAHWNVIVLDEDANRGRNRGMETQRLANDHVQVREGVELLHSGSIRPNSKKLLSKLLLHTRVLSRGKETPRRCRAGGLMPSDQESRDLYFMVSQTFNVLLK